MQCELVETTTRDGLRLHGAWHAATAASAPFDALLFLHGVTGNFYSSPLAAELARALSPRGVGVLRVNTRGHHLVAVGAGAQGPVRLGAAYERVDQCADDVAGWLEFAQRRGCHRVALAGHSLGAVKALYSQAHQPDDRVAAVVALSPPRLSYSMLLASPHGRRLEDAVNRAETLVAQGRGEQLVEVDFPYPLLMTAAGYLDKYGPAERYDVVRFAARVPQPTLLVFGTRELGDSPALAGLPQALRGLDHAGPRAFELIEGADHFYTGLHAAVAERVAVWLS